MIKFSLKLLTTTVLLSAVNINPSYSMENKIPETLNTNVSFKRILNYYLMGNANDYKENAKVVKTFFDKLLNSENLKKVLGDNNQHELYSINKMLERSIEYSLDLLKDNIEVLYEISDIVHQEKYNDIYYITNMRCKINFIINSIILLRKELPNNINLSFEEICKIYDNYSRCISIIQPQMLKKAQQKCSKIFCNKLLDNKSLANVLRDNNKTELYSIHGMLNTHDVIESLLNLLKDNTERLYEIFDIVHQEKYNDINYIADIRSDISTLMLLIGKELPDNINLSFDEINNIYYSYSRCISIIQPQKLAEAKQKCSKIFCNRLFDGKRLENALKNNNLHELSSINKMLERSIEYSFNLLKDNIEVLYEISDIVHQEKYYYNYCILDIRCQISSIINSIILLCKELPNNINLSFEEICKIYDNYSRDILSIQPQKLTAAKQKCIKIFRNKLFDNDSLQKVLEDNNLHELSSINEMLDRSIKYSFDLLKDNIEGIYKISDIVHQEKYSNVNYITSIRSYISVLILLIGKELPNNINLSFKEICKIYENYSRCISIIQPQMLKKAQQKCSEIFCNKLLDNKSLENVLQNNNRNELCSINEMFKRNDVIERLFNLLNDKTNVLDAVFEIVYQKKYNNKGKVYYINYLTDTISDISALMLLICKELPNNINLSFDEIYRIYKNYSDWDISSIQPEILKEAKQKCIEMFCNKLLDNESLKTLLQSNDIHSNYLCKINKMLQNDYVITYLSNLLVKKNDINDILQLVTENNNNYNKYIVDIKDTIKECIAFAQRINNILNNINNINQSKDIDDLFDYLLNKDFSNLEYLLKYGHNETLELIATILQNPEVQKNLCIARFNFLLSQSDCAIRYILKQITINSNTCLRQRPTNSVTGKECDICSEEDLNNVRDTTLRLLKKHRFGDDKQDSTGKTLKLDTVIDDYRTKLINKCQNNNAKSIVCALIHENVERYVDDAKFVYEGCQMLNELFKNKDDKFTFDNLRNVVQGNGTQEQIEKINKLFRQLVQYYISDAIDGSKVKKYLAKLIGIGNNIKYNKRF